MNSKTPNPSQQDVDLYFIWKNFMGFIEKIILLFIRVFRFLIRNIFVILALLAVGAVIGYFLDSNKTAHYKHEVILVPNFGSSTFLYEKVKNISFEEDSNITGVNIEPIIDIYDFLSSKSENLKIIDFMSQNNVSFTEHKPGNQTEKIYKYHLLTLFSNTEDVNGNIINSFLADLNQEKYFLERQTIEQHSTAREIEESLTSIQNINAVFQRLANSSKSGEKSELNIEMYPEINGLLYSKDNLIKRLNELEIAQVEQTKIFYDATKITNIKADSMSMMIILPFVLLLAFIALAIMIKTYKRYSPKTL